MEYLKGILFILIAAELILTFSLMFQDSKNPFCISGYNCETVQNSVYSEIFGLKLSYFGFISFSVLLIVYILSYNKKIPYWIFVSLASLSGVLGAYFLYIQKYVIGALCSICIATDSIAILIALISLYYYFNTQEKAVPVYQ